MISRRAVPVASSSNSACSKRDRCSLSKNKTHVAHNSARIGHRQHTLGKLTHWLLPPQPAEAHALPNVIAPPAQTPGPIWDMACLKGQLFGPPVP
jgi:hypothetical protein